MNGDPRQKECFEIRFFFFFSNIAFPQNCGCIQTRLTSSALDFRGSCICIWKTAFKTPLRDSTYYDLQHMTCTHKVRADISFRVNLWFCTSVPKICKYSARNATHLSLYRQPAMSSSKSKVYLTPLGIKTKNSGFKEVSPKSFGGVACKYFMEGLTCWQTRHCKWGCLTRKCLLEKAPFLPLLQIWHPNKSLILHLELNDTNVFLTLFYFTYSTLGAATKDRDCACVCQTRLASWREKQAQGSFMREQKGPNK